jgi:hypothetical protein
VENSLSAYQELLDRLNRSKTKQRRGSDRGRSAPAREALRKEQKALRDERRKGITLLGGGIRTADFQDRNGNRIDDRDEPGGSHYQEKPLVIQPGGDSFKIQGPYKQIVTDYYKPETGDTYTSYNSGDLPPTGYVKGYKPKSDKPVSSGEEKTPTTSSNRALTKAMLNRMAGF